MCALASLCNFRLIATDYTCGKLVSTSLVQISCGAIAIKGESNM